MRTLLAVCRAYQLSCLPRPIVLEWRLELTGEAWGRCVVPMDKEFWSSVATLLFLWFCVGVELVLAVIGWVVTLQSLNQWLASFAYTKAFALRPLAHDSIGSLVYRSELLHTMMSIGGCMGIGLISQLYESSPSARVSSSSLIETSLVLLGISWFLLKNLVNDKFGMAVSMTWTLPSDGSSRSFHPAFDL